MSCLVTGSAGYIGAHLMCAWSRTASPWSSYDGLSTGSPERIPEGVPLVVGSVLDRSALDAAIRDNSVTGVVHIAAKKQVGESVERPLHYYREMVTGLQALLEAVASAGVGRLVSPPPPLCTACPT